MRHSVLLPRIVEGMVTPSVLEGIGSVVDLGGRWLATLDRFLGGDMEDDRDALASDFEQIGGDLEEVLSRDPAGSAREGDSGGERKEQPRVVLSYETASGDGKLQIHVVEMPPSGRGEPAGNGKAATRCILVTVTDRGGERSWILYPSTQQRTHGT